MMYPTGTALSILLALSHLGVSIPAEVPRDTPFNRNSAVTQSPLKFPPDYTVLHPPTHLNDRRQSFDNTCGLQDGKSVKCDAKHDGGGPCCSHFGFCGIGPFYCGYGCQTKFGKCDDYVQVSRETKCGPKHKNKKCSLGDCCSANGKCGRSEAFCGKHCQTAFGECDRDTDPILETMPEPTRNTKPVPNPGRCGTAWDNVKCDEGFCCSAAGYCGKGEEFCAVPQNCQPAFGTCDSDDVPKGFDLSPSAQPRPQVGKVPYGQFITRCTKPRTIALSYDDGPSKNTMKLLDVLAQYGANGTFFLSGNTGGRGMIDTTDEWIQAVKRIIVEGHQLGSHSWSHPHMNMTSRDTHITDMIRNDRAITNIVGKFPTYMRPPYSECSTTSNCLQDMADIGYHVVGWEIDSHDWQGNTTLEQMKSDIDKVLNAKKADDNMLLIQHDTSQHAVELTKYILEQTQKKQWQAVTLGECLEDPEEFWYNDPVWIDPNAIARSDGANGCVVSAPDFCGQIQSFQNDYQCDKSAQLCSDITAICQMTVAKHYPTCEKYRQVCLRQNEFCETCGRKGRPDCKISNWTFNRFGN